MRVHHDGRASFAFRHLMTAKRIAERQTGVCKSLSFAAMTGRAGLALILLSKLRDLSAGDPYSASTANTNIEQFGNKILSFWEGDLPYHLRVADDGASLACDKQLDLQGEYRGEFSAHPVVHPTSGLVYAVSYTVSGNHDAVVVVLDTNLRFLRKVPLSFGRTPMIHSAAITDKYVVLFDFPLLFTPRALL